MSESETRRPYLPSMATRDFSLERGRYAFGFFAFPRSAGDPMTPNDMAMLYGMTIPSIATLFFG